MTELCLTILTMKNANPCENSETWRSITCALNGLCCYMRKSSKLCFVSSECKINTILLLSGIVQLYDYFHCIGCS